MREQIIQTAINKFLTWLAKKSVTALYRRTGFWTYSWGLNENTDLYLISEESYLDRHRFGVHEEKYADTPQTEPMKTADYCDICKQDMCELCIADASNPYCVPSHYEINYEPNDEPKTQMKTQNSNLTFETDTPQTEICDTCKYRSSNVFGNWCVGRDTCDRYEADTPQTDCGWEKVSREE